MSIFAIDFDDTIMSMSDRATGYKMGKPFPGAKETINYLAGAGHEIIIHSVRANTPKGAGSITDWMEYFGIHYDRIEGKPYADLYIDDRGISFSATTGWEAIAATINAYEEDIHDYRD